MVNGALSSSSRPLDADTRAFMEARFGYDVSDEQFQGLYVSEGEIDNLLAQPAGLPRWASEDGEPQAARLKEALEELHARNRAREAASKVPERGGCAPESADPLALAPPASEPASFQMAARQRNLRSSLVSALRLWPRPLTPNDHRMQPAAMILGGPTASKIVSPIRHACSPLIRTVAEPSITTPGPCGGNGSGVAHV